MVQTTNPKGAAKAEVASIIPWLQVRILPVLFIAVALGVTIFARLGWLSKPHVPQTVPVGGIVTLDGEPLADASIVFRPLDPKGAGACSLSNEHGVFELQTWVSPNTPLSGAAPGSYAVAVTKHAINGTHERPVEHLRTRETLLTPPKYADAKTSVLSATVVREGENKFQLRLESDAEATE